MGKYEYCLVVGAQHNYTDDENLVIDWYNAAAEEWIENGKEGPEPEILYRKSGYITGWKPYR